MAPPTKSIRVVTFTATEAAAVHQLLQDLVADPTGAWSAPSGGRGRGALPLEQVVRELAGGTVWSITHVSLMAQGNVIAAAALADFFTSRRTSTDLIVFYGCAGVPSAALVGGAYLVSGASYVSLGKVALRKPDGEAVTVHSKWCTTIPGEPKRLPVSDFPLGAGRGLLSLGAVGLDEGHVAATDKVIGVGLGDPPNIVGGVPTPKQWTYGEALRHAQDVDAGSRQLLIEMESYGIGQIAAALGLQDRVVAMRIATDSLVDHSGSDRVQEQLLLEGRVLLAHLLLTLLRS